MLALASVKTSANLFTSQRKKKSVRFKVNSIPREKTKLFILKNLQFALQQSCRIELLPLEMRMGYASLFSPLCSNPVIVWN